MWAQLFGKAADQTFNNIWSGAQMYMGKEQFAKQMDFAKNKYSIAMNDLKNAGLNSLLAFKGLSPFRS